jgi:hypothetical protein
LEEITKEREEKKSEVLVLETEHKKMDDQVNAALSRQKRQHELMENMIKLDKENRNLKAQINDLENKLEASDYQ